MAELLYIWSLAHGGDEACMLTCGIDRQVDLCG